MHSTALPGISAGGTRVMVGAGELAVSNRPGVVFTGLPLGSCLGVTIYDPVARAGGMLHAILPHASLSSQRAAEKPGMFVDSGITALLRAADELRLDRRRLQICAAGGAQLLNTDGYFNLGHRNQAALADELQELDLWIRAEQVGGLVSRALSLDLATGEVRLKTSGQSGETVLFRN